MKTLTAIIMIITSGMTFGINDDSDPPRIDTTKVRAMLKAYGVKHVDIVLRQTVVETGWYRCTHCSMKYNNIFGFRHKDYITPSNKKGYIPFKTIEEGVAYCKRWQDKYYRGGDYYEFLRKRRYSESPTYIDYLKKMW